MLQMQFQDIIGLIMPSIFKKQQSALHEIALAIGIFVIICITGASIFTLRNSNAIPKATPQEITNLPLPTLSLSSSQQGNKLSARLIHSDADNERHYFSKTNSETGFKALTGRRTQDDPERHNFFDSNNSSVSPQVALGDPIQSSSLSNGGKRYWIYEYSGNESQNQEDGKTGRELFDGNFWLSRAQRDYSPEYTYLHTNNLTFTQNKRYYLMTEEDLCVSTLDPDRDNLNNQCEEDLGTDPNNSDTDGGGTKDGQEVLDGTDPDDSSDDTGDESEHCSQPILRFSDIESGSDIGNSDENGDGAIVTIWGQKLGATQNSSRIYFEDSQDNVYEPYVYYWKNADGQLPGGPSDLYESHQMQEIAFSIPDSELGMGKIYVEVDGIKSNELNFTVREGNIYFIDDSGSDSVGNGSFNNPWKTLDYVVNKRYELLHKGDIIYLKNFSDLDGVAIGHSDTNYYEGNDTHPFSIIGYPGYSNLFMGNPGGAPTISNKYWKNSNWNFAKLFINTTKTGLSAFYRMRVIGNEITGPDADGMGGAISGAGDQAGGGKMMGNFIHDFGNETTTLANMHHTFYLSNRDNTINEAYEISWSHLRDIGANHGLHIYDQAVCGDWNGTFKLHHNYIIGQAGCGINISGGCSEGYGNFTYDLEIYQNIFINKDDFRFKGIPICLNSSYFEGNSTIFNNLLYGSSDEDELLISLYFNSPKSNLFFNNILLDLKGDRYAYYATSPTFWENNLFHSYEDNSIPLPEQWNSNAINSDPLFVDKDNLNSEFSTESPLIDGGSMVNLDYDFYGNKRYDGSIDIGPIENNNNQCNINHHPVLQAIPDKEIAETSTLTFTAQGEDEDDDTLEYSLIVPPVGASIVKETGEFTWTPTEDQLGAHVVTIRVRDGGEYISYDDQKVNINVTDSNNTFSIEDYAAFSQDPFGKFFIEKIIRDQNKEVFDPTLPNSYFISPNGSNNNDGSIDSPWKTILHAASNTGAGDTVYLREGNYNQKSEIRGDKNHGGSDEGWWTLTSYPGEKATIVDNALTLYSTNHVRITGLNFNGSYLKSDRTTYGGLPRNHDIEFTNNTFTGEQPRYGAIVVIGDNVLVENNTLIFSGGGGSLDHGIYLSEGNNNIVRGNYVSGAAGYGIQPSVRTFNDPAPHVIADALIEDNYVTNTRLFSGYIASSAETSYVDGLTFRNNISFNNKTSGLHMTTKSNTDESYIQNIDIVDNVFYEQSGAGVEVGNRLSDGMNIQNIDIQNNIVFVENADKQHMYVNDDAINVSETNNIYWPSPERFYGANLDPTSTVADPNFVDAAGIDDLIYKYVSGDDSAAVTAAVSEVQSRL